MKGQENVRIFFASPHPPAKHVHLEISTCLDGGLSGGSSVSSGAEGLACQDPGAKIFMCVFIVYLTEVSLEERNFPSFMINKEYNLIKLI
jgi:hypothetical protein